MKILHVPYVYYPDAVGGTEIYVSSLASQLLETGIESVIAAPAYNTQYYEYGGFPVYRFSFGNEGTDLNTLYGLTNRTATRNFKAILDKERPDILHLHAHSNAVSVALVYLAKNLGIPTVFTFHTPAVSCQRGTLLYRGSSICDGELRPKRCTECLLEKHGIVSPLDRVLSNVPPAIGVTLGAMGMAHGVWTALRMSNLVRLRNQASFDLFEQVNSIVVVCSWARTLLMLNNIPEAKIILSRHGITNEFRRSNQELQPPSGSPIRLAFLGRLDPIKGVEFIIRALKELPNAQIEFDIYAVVQPESSPYHRLLLDLAQNDLRIRFMPAVRNDQVVDTLSQYHWLVVPSQCLETGPLVVLEAFAARTPVIGSNLGGITELVRDGVNGLLVKPDSVKDWANTLARVLQDSTLYSKLRAGIRPPRLMSDVANDMLSIYTSLLSPKH